MGKKDTITKEYMSKPQYFADAFNSSVFKGKQVIKPDELFLEERDVTEMGIIITEDAKDVVQRVRDVLKRSVVMNDGKTAYLLLGIENQSDVHYAMPVRNLIYDALNYGQQVNRIVSMHKEKKDLKDSEFLSGFSKEDKLMPVITLTVYFGSGDWDAPRCLKDMFPKDISEEILEEVDDYKLHLIIPNEIEDFSLFQTDFGKAMKYIAVSERPDEVEKLSEDERFRSVNVDTVQLINECTDSNISIIKGEEVVNVCKGLEGFAEKRAARADALRLVECVDNLIKNLGLSLEAACNAIGSSIQKYEESKDLLKS